MVGAPSGRSEATNFFAHRWGLLSEDLDRSRNFTQDMIFPE
jgi:hypothetical protein